MCQLCRAVDRRTFLRGSALGGAATLLAPGAALAGDGRHEARRGRFDIGLRWFGTNGWELTFGSHRLLVDPYLTRLDVGIAKGKFDPTTELRSDRAAIDKHLKEADLILVTHGHYDHLADVPAVVERTGGRVLGSETHVNLLAALGVPADHLIPVSGGEALDFGGYTITAIPTSTAATRSAACLPRAPAKRAEGPAGHRRRPRRGRHPGLAGQHPRHRGPPVRDGQLHRTGDQGTPARRRGPRHLLGYDAPLPRAPDRRHRRTSGDRGHPLGRLRKPARGAGPRRRARSTPSSRRPAGAAPGSRLLVPEHLATLEP